VNASASGANRNHSYGYPIITGWGFLLATALRATGPPGGDEVVATSDFVSTFRGATGAAQTVGAFRVARLRRDTDHGAELNFILVFSSADYTDFTPTPWKLSVTPADFPGSRKWWSPATAKVTEMVLDPLTCPSNRIKADLIAAGYATDADQNAVAQISDMATPAGLRWLSGNASRYIKMGVTAVTPQPFSGSRVATESGLELTGTTTASSIILLTLSQS